MIRFVGRLFKKSRSKWELMTNHWKIYDDSVIHHFDEVNYEEKVSHKK